MKAALHEQLTRLKVEELALQSMIRSREEDVAAAPGAEDPQQILGQMDNEAAINQTELQLSIRDHEEEAEEEEESDSWGRKESKTVFNTDSGISSPFLPTDIHVVLCGLYDMLGSWSPRRLPLRTQMLQAWQILN